jgi:hypothetical protein
MAQLQQIRRLASDAERVLKKRGWRKELKRFEDAMADLEEDDPSAAMDVLPDILNRMDDEGLTGTPDEKLMDQLLGLVHRVESSMRRGRLLRAYRAAVGASELTIKDFKDFFEELAENGLSDRKQWQGMLDRAKEIAKKRGKPGDKNTITGILQTFMGGR